MAAYVIYQGEVFDQVRYDEYKAKAAESILAAGGRYIVRGGDVDVLEGEAPAGRTVVLEFPTRQAAIDWYRSDEYAEIRKIREGCSRPYVRRRRHRLTSGADLPPLGAAPARTLRTAASIGGVVQLRCV